MASDFAKHHRTIKYCRISTLLSEGSGNDLLLAVSHHDSTLKVAYGKEVTRTRDGLRHAAIDTDANVE